MKRINKSKKIKRKTKKKILIFNPRTTLYVCHGRNHGIPTEPFKPRIISVEPIPKNVETLDIRKETDPDTIADITSWDFTYTHPLDKNQFDQIELIYCPSYIYMTVKSGDKFRVSNQTIAIRQTFENLYFLLKDNGLLIINNFIISCLPTDMSDEEANNFKKWPDYVYENVKNFMKSINDLFTINEISKVLVLKKV